MSNSAGHAGRCVSEELLQRKHPQEDEKIDLLLTSISIRLMAEPNSSKSRKVPQRMDAQKDCQSRDPSLKSTDANLAFTEYNLSPSAGLSGSNSIGHAMGA